MTVTRILDEKARREIFGDNWTIRRRWMKLWTLGFAFNGEVVLGWTIWTGGSAYGTEIFMSLLTAITAVMFLYVFGAVWDDHSKRGLLNTITGQDDGSDPTAGVDVEVRPENPPAGER